MLKILPIMLCCTAQKLYPLAMLKLCSIFIPQFPCFANKLALLQLMNSISIFSAIYMISEDLAIPWLKNSAYYASIMLNAFRHLYNVQKKHNRRVPIMWTASLIFKGVMYNSVILVRHWEHHYYKYI